jgi:hypothetical protein
LQSHTNRSWIEYGKAEASFDELRGVVDPKGELTRIELYRLVGYRSAFDPDVFVGAFIRAAADIFAPGY